MIFSIAMGADCSFYVKSIATYAPAFFGYNSSVLASVLNKWFAKGADSNVKYYKKIQKCMKFS